MKNRDITVVQTPFNSLLNSIKTTASIYCWSAKNVARIAARICGQVLTTPVYLCYGLFWAVALLFKMGFIIIGLSYHRATMAQWQLEIGRVFLIHGANLQVGQPVRFRNQRAGKVMHKWVANLHFDFRNNCINTTYSAQPIPGMSNRFKK